MENIAKNLNFLSNATHCDLYITASQGENILQSFHKSNGLKLKVTQRRDKRSYTAKDVFAALLVDFLFSNSLLAML